MKNLINCPDCQNPTSKDAVNCPKCGKPIKPTATNVLATIILLCGFLIVIGFVVGTFNFSWNPTEFFVNGEVFVTAKDGQTYKFNSVQVKIYKTSDMASLSAGKRELLSPAAVGMTDREGKFSVKIPAGDYTAVADTSLSIAKKIEEYHWRENFTVSNEETKLVLNNSNIDLNAEDFLDSSN